MMRLEAILVAGIAAGACTMGATLAAGAPTPIAACFGISVGGFAAMLLHNLYGSVGVGAVVSSTTGHDASGDGAAGADGSGSPGGGQQADHAGASVEMSPWTGIMLTDRMQTGSGHAYFIEQAGGGVQPHEQG